MPFCQLGPNVANSARPPTYLQDLLLERLFDCLLVQTRVNVVSVAQSIEIVPSRHDRTAYRGVPCHICNKQHTIFKSNRQTHPKTVRAKARAPYCLKG